jgi:hypothetical protein
MATTTTSDYTVECKIHKDVFIAFDVQDKLVQVEHMDFDLEKPVERL